MGGREVGAGGKGGGGTCCTVDLRGGSRVFFPSHHGPHTSCSSVLCVCVCVCVCVRARARARACVRACVGGWVGGCA